MSINHLSTLLWRERELLELLHFKLEEEQLLLVSGKSRWIANATREVESVLEKVQAASLARSIEAAAVARELGVDAAAPLSEIAAAVTDETWQDILTAHLHALRDIAANIKALRDANAQYLRAAQRSTQETLATLGDDRSTYGRGGTTAAGAPSAHIIDTDL